MTVSWGDELPQTEGMGARIKGTGIVRSTFAAELVRAWASLSIHEAVGLAMRDHRRRAGTTQRAYARLRGWSKTHQFRLESQAEGLRLERVAQALQGTGFELVLRSVDVEGEHDLDNAAGGAAETSYVRAEDWPVTELVARDAQQRRFPPGRPVRRTGILGPDWWWRRYSSDIQHRPPEWTTGR